MIQRALLRLLCPTPHPPITNPSRCHSTSDEADDLENVKEDLDDVEVDID